MDKDKGMVSMWIEKWIGRPGGTGAAGGALLRLVAMKPADPVVQLMIERSGIVIQAIMGSKRLRIDGGGNKSV
jgi:hypothetical protein